MSENNAQHAEQEHQSHDQHITFNGFSGTNSAAPPPFQLKTSEGPIQRQDGDPEIDTSGLPEGKIRDAATALAASDREVESNTARRLADGDIRAFYIEDLTQPDDVEARSGASEGTPPSSPFTIIPSGRAPCGCS